MNLAHLLTAEITRNSAADAGFIKLSPPPPPSSSATELKIVGITFDIKMPVQFTAAQLMARVELGEIHTIRYKRAMVVDISELDVSALTIFPKVNPNNLKIGIKLGAAGGRVTGCKTMADLEAVRMWVGPCEIKIVSVSGAGGMTSKINLVQLSIALSSAILSPVFEPNKTRLIVKNINNRGGSITIFSRGTITIVGKTEEQVRELYTFITTWAKS